VKIKGTCRRCGRDVFAEQIVASGGRCPWDGEPFNPNYAVVLVDALKAAEEAGTALEQALEQVASLQPEFTLDRDSVTAGVSATIAQLSTNLVGQG
jgi:hypothetical protein